MREVGGGASRIRIAIACGDDGEIVQDEVPGGADYRLVANLDAGGGDYTLARFTMPLAGGEIDLGALELPELASITFRVERDPSADGATVEYLLERVDDNAARLLNGVGPVPKGPHRLPAGRYRLDVELSPGVRRSTPFVVHPGRNAEIGVRVDARSDFTFVVRGLERGERARLRLRLNGEVTNEPIERTAVVDPATGGDARFDPLPLRRGTYRLEVLAESGKRVVQMLPVGEVGPTRRIVIELR